MARYRKILYIFVLCLISSILLYNSTLYITNRITYFIGINKYEALYNNPVIFEIFDKIIYDIKLWFSDIWNNILNIFQKILAFFDNNFLIMITYIIQIVVMICIFFTLWLDGENQKYKESKLSKLLVKIVDYLIATYYILKNFTLKHKKKFILIFGFLSGVFPVLIFEGSLLLLDYLISFITFTSHEFLFKVFKYLFVMIFNFVAYGNKFLLITVLLVLFIWIAFIFAWKKLNKNWFNFRMMINDSATINSIDGEPGSGKTLTNAQATLASTENIQRDFEKELLEYEITHPGINMAKVRLMFDFLFLNVKEEKLGKILKYYNGILFDLFRFQSYQDSDILRVYFSLFYRGTSIISFVPMLDPYEDSYSRIGDVQTLRFFKELSALPFEPGITLMYPEIDKEFNSHDHISEIGEDGTHAAFALLSHVLERHGHMFMDAQMKTQLAKRIRGVAGEYYHLEYKKIKMPFLLNMIYKPVLKIYNWLLKLILAYLGEKPKTEKKWTVRRKALRYKRNNVCFLYQIMKYLGLIFYKMVRHFEKFQYFKIYAKKAYNDEMTDAMDITYNLNVMDFYHKDNKIYNSVQFKQFYDELRSNLAVKKGIKQNILLLDKWSSLDVSIAEYSKSHQRLLQQIIDAQTPKKNDEKK